jgi:hypothetical protein
MIGVLVLEIVDSIQCDFGLAIGPYQGGADLIGANLSGANLDGTDLHVYCTDGFIASIGQFIDRLAIYCAICRDPISRVRGVGSHVCHPETLLSLS